MAIGILMKCQPCLVNPGFTRLRHTKHWNPLFKKERQEKVIKVDLSELQDEPNDMSREQKQQKMKERGVLPQKPWFEKPLYLSCTGNIFETYVPPEGDGKFSSLSKIGAKQKVEYLTKRTKSYQAIKKIKKYEEEFDVNDFPDRATDIYIKAHEALMRKDEPELMKYVTEKLFPEITYNLQDKTLDWKLIRSVEPASVVHARCTSLLTDNNVFAQVTVRLHTQQVLVMFDRFGRLMSGTGTVGKDVMEYVVLEKHLSNEYGQWRLHAKIIPPWMPPRQFVSRTFVINNE